MASAYWYHLVRYHFHLYPPTRRVLPLGAAAEHKKLVCDQVNEPLDLPVEFYYGNQPGEVWQEESRGVWKLTALRGVAPPANIRVRQCGKDVVVDEDGQTRFSSSSMASAMWYGENDLIRVIQSRLSISAAPEFSPAKSVLPVCKQTR